MPMRGDGRGRRARAIAVLSATASLIGTNLSPASASAGQLDATFGGDGKVRTTLGGRASELRGDPARREDRRSGRRRDLALLRRRQQRDSRQPGHQHGSTGMLAVRSSHNLIANNSMFLNNTPPLASGGGISLIQDSSYNFVTENVACQKRERGWLLRRHRSGNVWQANVLCTTIGL